jgi:hypothetical protein
MVLLLMSAWAVIGSKYLLVLSANGDLRRFIRTYWIIIVNTFQVLDATFFACKRVLQVSSCCWLDSAPPPLKEFVAKENINYHKDTMVSEGEVCKDDETLLASNLPPPPELAAHPNITLHEALTFDPSPSL